MARNIARIELIAKALLRYGLVVAIGWIGAMKATHYEAVGIQPLIAHSPLLSWGYRIWSVDHFTMIIGATELVIVALLAVRPWFPRASALGSVGAICMFLTTLSFIVTRLGTQPGWISGSLWWCRRISDQRFRLARRCILDLSGFPEGCVWSAVRRRE